MRISDWSSDVCSSDLAPAEFAEQVDRLQSRLCGHCRCAPELPDKVDIAGREIHVRGKGGGKPAHLPPAHGVRLSGDGNGCCPRLADASGRKVDIYDGVHLFRAGNGLVDGLASRKSTRLNSSH